MHGPRDFDNNWSQSDKYHDIILYVETKKNYTNELIYKTETNSQTRIMNLWLPGEKSGEKRNRLGILDWHEYTAIFKIDNQQGLTL